MDNIEVRETLPPYPHQQTICVDFDGTLVKWDSLDAYHETALPGAKEAMEALRRAGRKIVIFTSRLDPTWLMQSNNDYNHQYQYVKATLTRLGIPFDAITGSKIPAFRYLDDRAITYDGDWRKVVSSVTTDISPGDLGWIAGVFEGEGYIYTQPSFPNQATVGIEMTDEDVIRRINYFFPGNLSRRTRLGKKPTYTWRRRNQSGCKEFLEAILPWLSERRALKASEVLTRWEINTIATHAKILAGTAKRGALRVGA